MKEQSGHHHHFPEVKMVMISSMYPAYLDDFYRRHGDLSVLTFSELSEMLLSDSTEFIASYARNFSKSGFKVLPLIANDHRLRQKWRDENKTGSSGDLLLHQIALFDPDIIWIEDLRLAGKQLLRKLREGSGKKYLNVLYHCAPVTSSMREKLVFFDIIITCTPGLKMAFEASGFRSYLVYHGFDQEYLRYTSGFENSKIHDVLFSGSLRQGKGYHGSRIRLLNSLLSKGLPVTISAAIEENKTLIAKKN